MHTVGLVVNPSAGRDIRRLSGAATVSDNYGKRRRAMAVLAGLASVPETAALVVPDKAGLGQHAVEHAPDRLEATLLDVPRADSGATTRTAIETLAGDIDCLVVLGGDGTTRDAAVGLGFGPGDGTDDRTGTGDDAGTGPGGGADDGDTATDADPEMGRYVPILAISTGTNNVVPSPVDGTAAGVAAGLVAAGLVPIDAVTVDHGMVTATVTPDGDGSTRRIRALATLGILSIPFTGTRAVLHGHDFVGGVVSRADPGDCGLSGIAGCIARHPVGTPGGIGMRLADPAVTERSVRAITVPGVIERIGVEADRRLDPGESMAFAVGEGTISVDGERAIELVDATVTATPTRSGPRIVDVPAVFAAAADRNRFLEIANRGGTR